MKTEDLTRLLAQGATPVPQRTAACTLAVAMAVTTPVVLLLMATLLGVRPDIADASSLPMFWVKLGVPSLIALAGWHLVERLARPGVVVGERWLWLSAPVLFVWLLGAWAWSSAAPEERATLFWSTWLACAVSVPLLSLPLLFAAFAALRRLAPTRPGRAGAAAGALSGGVAAAVYALHCLEMFAPFLAVWYVLGMSVPVVLGALLGPRLLRW